MVTRRFAQVDVFATTPYSGNPLAVVVDGDGLSGAEMQRFANWTNLSETSFLLPPTTPDADYRVRIFTPVEELPFAGHPTLGSAHVWLAHNDDHDRDDHDRDTVVQECEVGLVTLRRSDEGLAFAAPPLRRSGPADDTTRKHVAAGLRIDPEAIEAIEWVDNGPGWVAVLLADAKAVLAVSPGYVDSSVGLVGPHPAGSEHAFEVRGFFPKDGATVEDPVTGSLNASIAQWLLASGRATAPYLARQGTVLGRSGRVRIDQDGDGTIWVGGNTLTCVRGEVEI
ncbi:PhzF family phenazine biosynthesis protein [Pseudonocardia sp. GCM10023141]|uniref:PhzF family phenazine biosynthesis protein n=1 Tax=Pseudonocardia sp. GCM10023141 TaxID=3252653 RepID=UPI0036215262